MIHHDGQVYTHCDARHVEARLIAHRYFDRIRRQAMLRAIWQFIRGGSCSLLRLSDTRTIQVQQSTCGEEAYEVALSRIVGSDGRADDFDCAFAPLSDQDRERWVTLAALVIEGRNLPPVELVQVGDAYYVIDGHHRISVAHALGETSIRAHVQAVVPAFELAEYSESAAVPA